MKVDGTVVSNTGGQIEHWVEYGLTPARGSNTQHRTTAFAANQAQQITVDILGLQRSTTYHFRFCARDSQQSGGPGCGADKTFTTRNLDCGDVITTDVVLSGSMACDRALETSGLIVGAHGVDIDLGGHDLTGPFLGGTPQATSAHGVKNNGGFDDVTIRNGHLDGWAIGVSLRDARFNVIRNLSAAGQVGIDIRGGDGNAIRSTSVSRGRGSAGLSSVGSDHLVVADSSGPDWLIGGDRTTIVRNEVPGTGELGACLSIGGNHNRVADNRVGGCRLGGIVLVAGADNSLLRNEAFGSTPTANDPGNPDGIRVEGFTTGTLLRENFAHDNADDGIEVLATSARLRDNRAERNGDFGIDARRGNGRWREHGDGQRQPAPVPQRLLPVGPPPAPLSSRG